MTACHENHFNPNENITLDRFDRLSDNDLEMSILHLNEHFARIVKNDKDTTTADKQVRAHYRAVPELLWIDRNGVSPQADTLLLYINKVGDIGFSPEKFYVRQIEEDLNRMRSLRFDDVNTFSLVSVRLDYYLTKAFFRYYEGQRYGFVNPASVFNHLDLYDGDSTRVNYRPLYDVATERLGQQGQIQLLNKILADSVPEMLREAQPTSALYQRMKSMLPEAEGAERDRILVNMERCRWRHDDYPQNHDKYVLVNIPSYELLAFDHDSIMEMKMVCGSRKTKTPLLNSRIMRMDLNPQWIMPFSIVKTDMAAHAGDAGYFAARNYFITSKATGERMNPAEVTAEMLRSGGYKVAQEGGEGNALGRIIFRFLNDFSIYLHDTSTKSTFGRSDRSASHGCIRVEKPFELAKFLLADKDDRTLEKIRYSMSMSTRSRVNEEGETIKPQIDKSKIIHSLNVEPQVPLFITYFTLYELPGGELRKYDDVYGYDGVMLRILNNYR